MHTDIKAIDREADRLIADEPNAPFTMYRDELYRLFPAADRAIVCQRLTVALIAFTV